MSLERILKERYGYSQADQEILNERRKLGLEKTKEQLVEEARKEKIGKIKDAAATLAEDLGVKTQIKAIQGGYAIIIKD